MNLEQVLAGTLLLLIAAGLVWFAHRAPRAFLICYLLAATRFYGFVDFGLVEMQGVVNVMFYLNVALLVSSVIRLLQGGTLKTEGLEVLVAGFLLFFYGVTYPTVTGYSTVISSVTDGKDFLGYGLLGYLAVNRQLLDRIWLERMLDVLSIPLAVVVIAFALTGLHPPAYLPVGAATETGSSIHFSHPTFVSLALLVGSSRLLDRASIWGVAKLVLFLACLALQEHRSVMVVAVGMLLLFGFYAGLMKGRQRLVLIGVAVVSGLMLSPLGGTIRGKVQASFTELTDKGGAILSRERINSFRLEAIREKPLFGYGFIDETSRYGEDFVSRSSSPFTRTLGTVDAGYVDLMARFGAVGSGVLLLAYFLAILRTLRRSDRGRVEAYGGAFFLMGYFAIAYTWSVFSYEHGIVPAALAFHLCGEARN